MFPPQISTAALTAVRCCRINPGFSRPARILSIVTVRPVTSASDERMICPPPSPCDPSIEIIVVTD